MVFYTEKLLNKTPFTARNYGPEPYLEGNNFEGYLHEQSNWKKDLTVYDRLFKHQTMTHARKRNAYKVDEAPKDHLDYTLEALYDPVANSFPDKVDPYLHKETVFAEGDPRGRTWRVLRNRVYVCPPRVPNRCHPLVTGGMTERESIYHLKLGISSTHSPQTNPGFTRNPSGGFYGL